jgi:putative endonuclease
VEYHNLGLQRHTKKWLPYILVFSEEYKTKIEALKRERFFKSGKGREVLKRLINSGCSAVG